jgi:hypothetical protein
LAADAGEGAANKRQNLDCSREFFSAFLLPSFCPVEKQSLIPIGDSRNGQLLGKQGEEPNNEPAPSKVQAGLTVLDAKAAFHTFVACFESQLDTVFTGVSFW